MEFKTDKLTYHDFWGFYEKHFKKYKTKELNILEIGVLKGESLRLLKEYFTESSIYGIDINRIDMNEDRIKIFNMSQIDFNSYKSNFGDLKFDIIIDDGSHITSHQIDTFIHLFDKMLNNDGLYIIEDLHTSFRKEYIDTEITAFEMVNNLKNKDFIETNFKNILKFYNNIDDVFIFKKNENDFYDSITSVIYKK